MLFSTVLAANAEDLSLAELVRQVKQALLTVEQNALVESLPSVKEAKITVNSLIKVGADGKVSFFVVSFGADTERALTNQVELTLVPPPADSEFEVSETALGDALAGAIIAGAEAIEAAGKGDPPLIAKSLTATIVFAVMVGAGGGIEVAFPPFSGELGGEASTTNTHTIAVTYEDPS